MLWSVFFSSILISHATASPKAVDGQLVSANSLSNDSTYQVTGDTSVADSYSLIENSSSKPFGISGGVDDLSFAIVGSDAPINIQFSPSSMPTETGVTVMETVIASVWSPQQSSTSTTAFPHIPDPNDMVSASRRISRLAKFNKSRLRNRGISNTYNIYTTTGSMTTHDGTTAYTVPVNQISLIPLFSAAYSYGMNHINLPGNESNHDYYRFTLGGLTLVATAYGECGSGIEPFNWGDFASIAQILGNQSVANPDIGNTWQGYVQTLPDLTRCVDFFVTQSFVDQLASNTTQSPETSSIAARTAMVTQAEFSSPRARRLDKRVPTINLGIDNVRMTIRTATVQVFTGLLSNLATNALQQLVADSGLNPTYGSFASSFNDPNDPGVTAAASQNIFQFAAERDSYISKDILETVLEVLIEHVGADSKKAGQSPALYGEVIHRGRIIARWSLGLVLKQFKTCGVEHPDGTYAVGCFLRYYNP